MRPSDCHPHLTDDRLMLLADFFASTREQVMSLHDSAAGDDNWSVGCRTNARWRNGLVKKNLSGDWPWLSIINPTKRFVFGVGDVPVRFFRGVIDNPPLRTLALSAPELAQMAFAFEDTNVYRKLHWRIAIETGLLGEPTAVLFAALARINGQVVHSWPIPFVAGHGSDLDEPMPIDDSDLVQLPPPTVLISSGETANSDRAS